MKQTAADAIVFQLLWATAEPVTPLQLEERGIGAAQWVGERGDNVVINQRGEITAFCGLSIEPTQHSLDVAGRKLWTWCAYDAVGILAAWEASGIISSQDPQTNTPLEIHFEEGRPVTNDVVIFVADAPAECVPRVDWCPVVNFFESETSAHEWAAARGVTGKPLRLPEATRLARQNWLSLAKAEPHA